MLEELPPKAQAFIENIASKYFLHQLDILNNSSVKNLEEYKKGYEQGMIQTFFVWFDSEYSENRPQTALVVSLMNKTMMQYNKKLENGEFRGRYPNLYNSELIKKGVWMLEGDPRENEQSVFHEPQQKAESVSSQNIDLRYCKQHFWLL